MNKKSLVLVIIVECVLAILLISFFGKAIESLYEKTLCSDIYFVDEQGNRLENNAMIEVDISDTKTNYQLLYVIEPKAASEKKVEFSATPNEYVIIDKYGNVTFLKEYVDVAITIHTTDGSGKQATIRLSAI
ncbi:MAG: hypothetical protein IKV61_02470 [Clostridia bacterium]|nr:hypothetical protein [Clostridia bacterium]